MQASIRIFQKNNIAYSYVYVDTVSDEELDEIEVLLSEYTSFISYPMIISEGHDIIIGYDKNELDKLIEGKKR